MTTATLHRTRACTSGRLCGIAAVAQSSPSPDDSSQSLRFLLSEVARARAAGDTARLERVVNEILTIESWAIAQKVQIHGYRKTGNAWVDTDEIADVTQEVLRRVARFLRTMNGTSVGELRAGINTAVHFEVIDHLRRNETDKEHRTSVDPGHFTGGLDAENVQYGELLTMAASNSAEDRAEFKERLGALLSLEPRDAEVVYLRQVMGYSSKEVAEMLGLTPANVDQIVSRSTRKLPRPQDD